MPEHLITTVKAEAARLFTEIRDMRHELHRHPELSFQEAATAGRIKAALDRHGIPYTDGWAGHGVVASIRGALPGPVVMLRGDTDALPIHEENDVPYRSVVPGVMHACGHDVHTSALLGAGIILHRLREHLRGEVRLIFQPGEERLPGGASIMLKEGLFRPEVPARIVAQHVFPPLPAGHVGFRSGMYMASSDELYITINGKGGHAATPHTCIDPIPIAARIVTALQELISRTKDPLAPGVLTIGKIWSDGGATNIIPDRVLMEGTLRAMDESWRVATYDRITDLVQGLCKASGATADVRIEKGYPALRNDEAVTAHCRKAAIAFLGEAFVHDLPLRMSSEDFAFYAQEAPGCFYRLGTGFEDPLRNAPVHTSRFDIDERALETGMGLLAFMALSAD